MPAWDFVSRRYFFFILSAAVIIPGLVSLLLPGGVRLGIDFTSGTIMTLRFQNEVAQADLRQAFFDLGHPEAVIQRSSAGEYIIRTRPLVQPSSAGTGEQTESTEATPTAAEATSPAATAPATEVATVEATALPTGAAPAAAAPTTAADATPIEAPATAVTTEEAPTQPTERQLIIEELRRRFGPVEVIGFDQVSPIVAGEIIRNSILAVLAACVGILLYLWWAFRRLKDPWRYGACAVIALVHDSLAVLGIFSILGRLFHIELDALFITAVLTVIGFSVHDTIVVFDRTRENLTRYPGEPFATVVNHSLTQTLVRSLNTSLTVILTLVTLLLFGGPTIRTFVLALLIGIITGTYSSIFNASLFLVVWENGEIGRLWRRITGRSALQRQPA